MPNVYISRQPLVNRQSKIIANRLTLHFDDGATTRDAAKALNALMEFWPQPTTELPELQPLHVELESYDDLIGCEEVSA